MISGLSRLTENVMIEKGSWVILQTIEKGMSRNVGIQRLSKGIVISQYSFSCLMECVKF